VGLDRTVSTAAVRGSSVIHIRAYATLKRSRIVVARSPCGPPFLFFLLLIYKTKKGKREIMHWPDPTTLPSITFVLSQAQPAITTRGSMRRRGKFGVRRSKSSPSFGAPDRPHPPRYPPQLDSDFLEVREPLSISVPFLPR